MAVCFLLLATIAVNRDGMLFGRGVSGEESDAQPDPAEVVRSTGMDQVVVSTLSLTKDIFGYGGNVPLEIYVNNGIVDHIRLLPNNESPDFLKATERAGVLSAWNGLSVSEALVKNVDAVSGATFTSGAIIKSAGKGFAYLNRESAFGSIEHHASWFDPKGIGVLLTLLSGLMISFYIKTKQARTLQLVLNIIVLGCWTGNFVSISKIAGFLSQGWSGVITLIPLIFICIAFLFPLFGKKGYYCAWVCPLGSLQEVAGKTPWKFKMPPRLVKNLDRFREILWLLLLFVMWLGVGFELLNYELFAFFLFQHAGIGIVIVGIVFTLLSTVINRPYCRFVCPTGSILKWCSQTK